MAFQTLYRKYRPQRFGEIVGQEHVTTALLHAVRDGRVGHAYLFSGPRGDGKTTTARLLAKAVNCLDLGADGEPCTVCENCVAVAEGRFNDLVEMDAASNNGVDAIRDLVDRVSLGLGATSRRKVYLIDEVHMLSTAASNALLKTLEEPPEHVVFVLATTNPEKVLPTIRSRTQHFEFSLLAVAQIAGLVGRVLDAEGVAFEPEAVEVIARAASGSARDALSLLDQAIAQSDGVITAAGVSDVFGGSPMDARLSILDAIAAADVAGALIGLGGLLTSGHEPRRVSEDLLAALRGAFLLVAGRGRVDVDLPPEDRDRLADLGGVMGEGLLVRGLETLGRAVVDMRGADAADPRLVLEIALVRLARRDTGTALQALTDRVERLERAQGRGASEAAASVAAASPPPAALETPGAQAVPRPRLGRTRRPDSETPGSDAAPAGGAGPNTPTPLAGPEPSPAKGLAPSTLPAASGPAATPPAAVPPLPDSATAGEAVVGAAQTGGGSGSEAAFLLDDVIVAWSSVLDGLARSVRSGVQEAQPIAVEGNVIVFAVAPRLMDLVKPRFHKEAQAIREAFIARLGAVPRFNLVARELGDRAEPGLDARPLDDGAGAHADSVPDGTGENPDGPPDADETAIDPDELVDAPPDVVGVDSVTRLQDAFGATVVEERPRDGA